MFRQANLCPGQPRIHFRRTRGLKARYFAGFYPIIQGHFRKLAILISILRGRGHHFHSKPIPALVPHLQSPTVVMWGR
jgi:hypothetical protein